MNQPFRPRRPTRPRRTSPTTAKGPYRPQHVTEDHSLLAKAIPEPGVSQAREESLPAKREESSPAQREDSPVAKREERSPAKDMGSRVIDAKDRFLATLKPAPWMRTRRFAYSLMSAFLALVVAVVLCLFFLPQLQVQQVDVKGTSYVDTQEIKSQVAFIIGEPIAFLDSGRLEEAAGGVAGVESAQIERHWPNTVSITVQEREPLARVQRAGKAVVVDSQGVELPEASAQGVSLPTLTVDDTAADQAATEQALLTVLAALPINIRESMTAAKASSPSNVTLVVNTDKGERTIVWGSAEESPLKAKVVVALLGQPGGVIDVSAPRSPTIR